MNAESLLGANSDDKDPINVISTFIINRGVQQGCELYLCLFNVHTCRSDLQRHRGKARISSGKKKSTVLIC